MELRKTWISLLFWIVFLSSQYPVNTFFIPQFLRRERLVRGGLSTRGQVGGVEDVPSFRFVNRPGPGPYNALRQVQDPQAQQNFQVPDALCLACGSFPWTPVAGKEQPQQPPPQAQPPPPQPITDQQIQSGPPSFIEEYPVHQHLEVTRQPGNTVVINALGPEEGSRRPYAFNFNSSPQQNNITPQKDNQPQPQPQQPQPQTPPTYGRPIVIPYEQPQLRPNDVPRTPSASSVNTQTVVKPPQPTDGSQKQPGLYASQNQPPFNQPPPPSYYQGRYPSPANSPLHPQNIPPITVGTILAAQQHYQVTPAKLVYQEHSQGQGQGSQNYGSGPRPAQSQVQMTYKLPILPPRGPSGTVMINQVPLHAVPNYSPPPPQFIPIPQSQQEIQFVEMNPPPPYGQAPRQPKPGHVPLPLDFNKYRVPQQQQFNSGPQQQFNVGQQQQFNPGGQQQQQFNFGPQQQFFGVQQQQYHPQPSYGPLPQKPLPPLRPYTPPQPSSEPRPQFTHSQRENIPPPTPTYIPPKLTGQGQLFGSYAEESKEKEEILSLNHINEEAKANQNQLHFPTSESAPSGPEESEAQDSNPNTQSSFFTFTDTSANQNEPEQPRPITIPHLLQIHQGYKFVDKPVSTLVPGRIYKEEYAQPQKELIESESQTPPKIKEQEPIRSQQQPAASAPQVEIQTNPNYVVRSPSPGISEESRGGRYEIQPATQYEITHLFNPGQQQEVQGQSHSDEQRKDKPFPVPVPVPITEAEVANSKSPIFVVGPPTPLHEEDGAYYSSSSFGQSGGSENKNQKSISYFQTQAQYDPLPPSVISALHHAQRTSFLTHSHHTPNNNQKTIYVNSIPVSEPNEPVAYSGPRVIRPIAFDLNSGKEIQISSEGDLNTLKIEGESDKRIFPVFRLQEESVLRPVLSSNENPGDQTFVNCQNNQHWVVPPPQNKNQHPITEADQTQPWNQDGSGSYYYSQQPVYWTIQDADPSTTPLPSTTTVKETQEPSYGEKLVQNESQEDESVMQGPKTYFAKPVLKWSKIIVPKSKQPFPAVTTTNFPTTNQNEGESTTEITHNIYGKDHVAQVDSVADDELESESKEVVSGSRLKTVDEGYPVLLESGGNKVDVIGPTTVADCVTESTEPGATEEGVTTVVTTTNKPSSSSSTFSPRIHPKNPEQYKIRNSGSRFPGGRPTISPFRRTTEDPYSGVSASVLVPVYRPAQGIYKSLRSTTTPSPPITVEDIYKSQEMKELGADDEVPSTGTTPDKISSTPPTSFSTSEDDEADELRHENQLGEFPTGRRVQSSSSHLQSIQGDKSATTTARILFSSQIIQSTPPTESSGPTSTKIVKTVRVRQRLRPTNYRGFTKNSNTAIRSRVRVMTTKPQESALPEGETLGADEEKEVKEALIEIRKI